MKNVGRILFGEWNSIVSCGAGIEFFLYFHKFGSVKVVKIRSFRYILPDELVSVFDKSLLPGGVWVGEVYRYAFQRFCDQLVLGELRAVISGYCEHAIGPVGKQQPTDGFSEFLGLLAMFETVHDHIARGAFDKDKNGLITIFADDQVHLPVAEAFPVRLGRTVFYGYPVRYIACGSCFVRIRLTPVSFMA